MELLIIILGPHSPKQSPISHFNTRFNGLALCVHTVSDSADGSFCSDLFVADVRGSVIASI